MKGKTNILLTGASGFLGQIIQQQLAKEYAISTLGRGKGNTISCDLGKETPSIPETFQMVIHVAGKAHMVPKTEEEKQDFFRINHQGTVHLLKALDAAPALPQQLVFISTVAVYGLDQGEEIREETPLNGQTPYAYSKILAEKAIEEWATDRRVPYVILRPPLIVGPGAPGNLGSIRRAIQKGYYFRIQGNEARKSAILASDLARLIPQLSGKSGIYNLTDGYHPHFSEIEDAIAQSLQTRIKIRLPFSWVKALARLGDHLSFFPLNSARLEKMTATLTFSDEKARRDLAWNPKPVLDFLSISEDLPKTK